MADPSPSAPAPAPPPAPPQPGRPRGLRKWLYRAAAVVLVPLLVFGLLELALRAFGYGHTTRFFLDGSKLERPGTLIDNREFGRWVFPRSLAQTPFPVPFAIPDPKPAGTVRVFVLGESAAMGFPEPSVSFPRVLEVMLRARYPGTRIEVVNAAMVAINSHVVLPIARECAGQSPDLLVVHVGNNEVVGPFGAAGVLGSYSPSLRAIRASLAVRRTRTGQLLGAAFRQFGRDDGPRVWQGMSMFTNSHVRAGDDRLGRTREHLRENLRDVCRAGADAGAPVVVCTIPVNLKDSAPFASLHDPGLSAERTAEWDAVYAEGVRLEAEGRAAEALARYDAAAGIDDQYADLAFRRARCLTALGRAAEARDGYARARDLDTLRFRSDAGINQTIREVAAERAGAGVHLADAERAFDEASPGGVPGENLFLEHVHLNFSGNYLLARTAFRAAAPILDARLGGNGGEPTEAQCAAALAYTEWNELKIASQVAGDLLRQPPFTNQLDRAEREARWAAKLRALGDRVADGGVARAVAAHRAAVEASDADWMLRMNYGLALAEAGNPALAEDQYRAALGALRHCFPARCKLGQLCLQSGRIDAAAQHFQASIDIAPDWVDGHYGMAEVMAARGQIDEGVAIYEARLKEDPDRATVLLALGSYLYRAGRLDAAQTRLKEAAPLKPDNTRIHLLLGDIALKQGRRAEAVGHYEAALRLRPEWPELQAHVARVRGEAPK